MWLQSLVVLASLVILPCSIAETSTPNTGDQTQAFTFAYTTSNLVLPITDTCPTPLTLTQLTTTNSGGPDPVAPYTMVLFVHEQLMDGAGIRYERIYAKSVDVGNLASTQDIQHPWMNGTQFIGCIWSSNAVSGGCQDLFTVVPSYLSAEAYLNASSQCRTPEVMGSWVTNQSNTLEVDVEGSTGTVSWNAWPKACTDLKFTPKNGTGPYTLVIAPAAHPPVNITSDTSMNYTVRLTHGQAFFAAMFDSAGNSWAFGPLHSGQNDDLECLAVATGQKSSSKTRFGIGALVGGIVGAFVVGTLGALAFMFCFGKKKAKKSRRSESQELLDPYADPRPLNYRVDSGTSSFYPKSIQQPYTDSSPQQARLGTYESPSTLYDGSPNTESQSQSRPQSQSQSQSRSFSRPNSDPFTYPESSGIGMKDFHPSGPSSRDREQSGSWRGESAGSRARGKTGRMHAGSPTSREQSGEWDDRSSDEEELTRERRRTRNVYVVHSDGGGDVHIQLPDAGSRVVELPPTYRDEQTSTSPRPHPYSPTPRSPLPIQGLGIGPGQGQGQSQDTNSELDRFMLPYLELEPTRSRNSGLSEVSMPEAELRARAEAALAEKTRPLSGSSHHTLPR
ncbi:hypothetical protein BCR39DRAFT_529562 [Naematelia encephala]|uniref:Uncharacterized protein n=1 Tax=Naematelia encephala TaxID=71784 RepID=A0A1Y2B6C4_9TREE|nr:hypothetical protein BCR39DRAFT_529562 [Naematelia encephala]